MNVDLRDLFIKSDTPIIIIQEINVDLTDLFIKSPIRPTFATVEAKIVLKTYFNMLTFCLNQTLVIGFEIGYRKI
jgi:hypothetical protein